MNFELLEIFGCYAIHPQRNHDDRGFLEKDYDEALFESAGLNTNWIQENTSFTRLKGTVRGLHIQLSNPGEIKRIKCLRGKVFDVFLDLRPNSPTYSKWGSFNLSQESGIQIYLPAGVAHGYQSLTNDVLLKYSHNVGYQPELAETVHFADSNLAISWPLKISKISSSDLAAPSLEQFVRKHVL